MMKIQKGIVKYKDRSDIVCTYGTLEDNTTYYFLDFGSDYKLSNGNIIASKVISMLGKSVAGNLLKLIPGFGTAAGAAINATVAATITGALGYALVQLTKKAIEAEWSGDSKLLENLFTEENINKYVEEYKKKHK